MSRAVKTASVTFGSATFLTDLESVPVGVPTERETYDISAFGDTVKKFAASQAVEKGEFDIEVLHIGEITDDGSAKALTVSITPTDSANVISISFGNCFLVKVEPGTASTGDKKATQKLTFRPEGGTPADQSPAPQQGGQTT